MTIVITVSRIETLNNSVWGNPRFKLHTANGAYTTMSDAAFNVGIMNGWNSHHDINGRLAKVELTRAGRVRDLKWVDAPTCADMAMARGQLERLKDARSGTLGDSQQAKDFEWALEVFNQTSIAHHRETECTEFH